MESEKSGVSRKRKAKNADEIHSRLMCKLVCDYLDERVDDGRVAKKFRMKAEMYLQTPADKGLKDPEDILNRLREKNYISPGSYDNLIEIVGDIDVKMVEEIKNAEKEIKQLNQSTDQKSEMTKRPITRLEENILVDTSLELKEHESDQTFVHFQFLNRAEQILRDHGIIAIVGRQGSGKTKCALELLSKGRKKNDKMREERKEESRNYLNDIPLYKLDDLTKVIELVNGNETSYVWFENLFEVKNGNYLKSHKSYFETITAMSRQGNVKFIFTINSTFYELYKYSLRNIFGAQYVINLDSEEYKLNRDMKLQVLKSHLRNNKIDICSDEEVKKLRYSNDNTSQSKVIGNSEVEKILSSDPYVGFPQCCRLFASTSEYFAKGSAFFDSPTEELVRSVQKLRLSDARSDQQQYLALCYIVFNEDKLNLHELDTSNHFDLFSLLQIDKVDNPDGYIRRGADILKETSFLNDSTKSRQILELQHSCIKTATMLSISRISSDAFMKVFTTMSTVMLSETIKLANMQDSYDALVVPECLYSRVADNLLMRLQNGDYAALSIPLWNEETFLHQLMHKNGFRDWTKISGFQYACRYEQDTLAKAILQMMRKEEGLSAENKHRQLFLGLKESCLNGCRRLVEMTVPVIKLSVEDVINIVRYIRYNPDLCTYLLKRLDKAFFDEKALQKFFEILVRDDSLDAVKYIFQDIITASEMQVRIASKVAGRVGCDDCISWLIETYVSFKNSVIEECLEGCCVSGNKSLLVWVMEHFLDQAKYHAFKCLQLACAEGLPDIVEKLHQLNTDLSKWQLGELLNTASFRGFPLVVKVLLDKNDCFTYPDIHSALEIALRQGNLSIVKVIRETYTLSQEEIRTIEQSLQKRCRAGPLSAYPFTPENYQNIPSVNISTPGIYKQKYPEQTTRRVLKRCLDLEYTSKEMNIYRRAMDIFRLCNSETELGVNNIEHITCIRKLFSRVPKIPEDLIYESLQLVCSRELVNILSIIIEFYPDIWKVIFKTAYLNENARRKRVLQFVHDAIYMKGSSRLCRYIECLQDTQNDSDSIINFSVQSHLKFFADEIYEAVGTYAMCGNVLSTVLLNEQMHHLCNGYSMSQLLIKASEENNIAVVNFLIQNEIIGNNKELIKRAFERAYMSGSDSVLQFLTVESGYLRDEDIIEAFIFSCRGNYQKSVQYFTDNHAPLILENIGSILSKSSDPQDNLVAIALIKEPLLSKCSKKVSSKLLELASQRNWSEILSNANFLDKCNSLKVKGSTVVKCILPLIVSKDSFAVDIFLSKLARRMIRTQRRTVISKLLEVGAELFCSTLILLTKVDPHGNGIPTFCIEERKCEILKEIFNECFQSFITASNVANTETDVQMIVSCLPPLTEEECLMLWKDPDHWNKSAVLASLMIQKYKLSDSFTQKCFLDLCRRRENTEKLIVVHRQSLSDEILLEGFNIVLNIVKRFSSSSADNINLLRLLPYVDLAKSDYIARVPVILYALLVIETSDFSDLSNTIYHHITKSQFNINTEEDLQQKDGNIQTRWKTIQRRFADFITHEIIIDLLHLCIENSNVQVFTAVLYDHYLSPIEVDHLLHFILESKNCYRESECFLEVLRKYPTDRRGMHNLLKTLSENDIYKARYLLEKYSDISDDDIYKSLHSEAAEYRAGFLDIISKLL